jgi:sugar lactone lactonase YvrE
MTDTAELFIDSRCELGEGPMWHPGLQQLFWFDILNKTLFAATPDGHIRDRFIFKDYASAAGVLDNDTIVVASSYGMLRLELETDEITVLAPIEPDKPGNRTNDGRVHPSGTFWIGTMSRAGGPRGQGSVYLYREGKTEKLFGDITVPNSTCFSPDGRTGYFVDGPTRIIKKVALDPETGKPIGEWEPFVDANGHRGGPDGSVIDAEGYMWNARWGGSCVVRHAPDGSVDRIVEVPALQTSCPCFGGKDLRTLYITTAREHMTPAQLEQYPLSGSVFAIEVDVPGQPEPEVAI